MKKLFYIVVLIFIGFDGLLLAAVEPSALFTDNMVLQQNTEVQIWGTAKAKSEVRIQAGWLTDIVITTADKDGKFRTKIKTAEASYKPYTLSISDSESSVSIQNVLMGEVWLCSGQSNMEMPMRGYYRQPIAGGPNDILNSTNRNLRCFTVKQVSTVKPQEKCEGQWLAASPATTGSFTATGFYFARMLQKTLDIPVGIISCNWSSSTIEAWLPKKDLEDIPSKIIPKTEADIKYVMRDPTVLYNGMINPIIGYGIAGVIWYQGEQNRPEPELYITMFERLLNTWRAEWGMGDFPFYYCQIAPYNYNNGLNSAFIREAQAKCMQFKNTGMAVLMDANSPYCIHPPKKNEAGERLARWALAKTYGYESLPHRSPEYASVEFKEGKAIVSFNYIGESGLTSYGQEVKNFTIAGADKKFYPATAEWTRQDKIIVSSPSVTEPVAVRYCFDNISATEIFSVDAGLPLSSFRTDNWTIE